MRVRFTRDARQELRSIGDYIARHSVERASSFIRDLRAKALEIGANPLAHPVVYRRRGVDLRRRVHAGYLIFYVVSNGTVDILHIIQGARNVEAVLFPRADGQGG